jgi:putative ABC transport system permease protein
VRNLWRNLQFGFRLLWNNPGFTSVAVLALALGIGANTAIFSVVYATLLAPLPYRKPEQLVIVWAKIQGDRNVTSVGDYLDWQRESSAFQSMAAWTGGTMSLSTSNRPEQVAADFITPGFLTLLGQPLLLGRDFLPEEGAVGKNFETVLSYKTWKNRFAGDRDIIGRQIRTNGSPYTVVGVLAPGVTDRRPNEIYVPLAFKPEQINHDYHWLFVVARLKPGVTLAQANADMDSVTRHIAEVYPKSNHGWGATVEALQNDFLNHDVRRALWMLLGAVGFVLLIACANVANLLLARGTVRQKEVAVRAAMGATRSQLFGQFLTESLALAAIGGALGVGLAWSLLKVILTLMPRLTLPSEADVRLNLPVLLFSLGATMLAGVLFGCAPAWQAMQLNLNDTLKESGRSGVSGGRHTVRHALVLAEFALALTLLAAAGLSVHSFWNLTHVNLGFRTDHILTFALSMWREPPMNSDQINAFCRQLEERVQAFPGITSVSFSTGMPVRGPGFGLGFHIVGTPVVDRSQRPDAGFNMVSPGYLDTFGIRISRGRGFTPEDRAGGVRVAIINSFLAKEYFPNVDPLTQRLELDQIIPGVTQLGPPVAWQIVGVYENVRNSGPKDDGFPEIDVPFSQSPWPAVTVAVRTAGDPASVSNGIGAVVRSLDPDMAMADVETVDQLVDDARGGDRFSAVLFGSFAVIALLLAAFGIYGVMSFAVAQRTHEIGLRMALGANPSQVLGLILKEGMALGFIGLLIGLGGSYAMGRMMRGMWYGIDAIDPLAFSAVAAILMLSAFLACYVPARRATRVDPMAALREQ